MKRQWTIIAVATLSLVVLVIAIVVSRLASRPRYPATEQDRQIAEACLRVLLTCTNDVELLPDDPRLPTILRDLNPVSIMIMPSHEFVLLADRTNTPSEFHLSRKSKDSKTWILYVVPPSPPVVGHVEALRIESD